MAVSKKNITTFTLDPKRPPKAKKADLRHLDALRDEDINYSDIPQLDEQFWKNVRLLRPTKKEMISLRVDKDIVDWFRKQGRGYQGYMNAILRSFVEARHS